MDNERRRSEEEGTEEEFEGRGRTLIRRVHVCQFCVDKNKKIDYKNVEMLRSLVSDRGKIRPRRQTGVNASNQRKLARAIKRARHLALLSYTDETLD